MNSANEVSTDNTRVREMPEFPGAKVEAIATSINIDYRPVTPLDTTVVLSYQDFVTNADGIPFPFTAPGLSPIHLSLAELISICGEAVDIPKMMEDLKIIADLVHNHRNTPQNLSPEVPEVPEAPEAPEPPPEAPTVPEGEETTTDPETPVGE